MLADILTMADIKKTIQSTEYIYIYTDVCVCFTNIITLNT